MERAQNHDLAGGRGFIEHNWDWGDIQWRGLIDCCGCGRRDLPPRALFRWHNVIQYLIHRQFRQHHDLRDALRGFAVGAFEGVDEVVEHDVG